MDRKDGTDRMDGTDGMNEFATLEDFLHDELPDVNLESTVYLPHLTPHAASLLEFELDMAGTDFDVADAFLESLVEGTMPVPDEPEQPMDGECGGVEHEYYYPSQSYDPCETAAAAASITEPEDGVEKESVDSADNRSSTSNSDLSDIDYAEELPLNEEYCVSAWKRWVGMENARGSTNYGNPWPEDFLQLSPVEMSNGLCRFMTGVRRTDGDKHAPDTIYYLLIGLQHYLLNSGRAEHFWSDKRYEAFAKCFDEVSQRWKLLIANPVQMPPRVTEEHLWLSEQLGTHSPIDLLTSLIYFNTKYYHLHTVAQHAAVMSVSIWRCWTTPPGKRYAPKQDNLVLRYTTPETLMLPLLRRVCYEQTQNEEDPSRCPVSLYDFYVKKSPPRGKDSPGMYYLQPERVYTPSSPIWFTDQPISETLLELIFRRLHMVYEIERAIYKRKKASTGDTSFAAEAREQVDPHAGLHLGNPCKPPPVRKRKL